MRVGLISDIHANLPALEAVLDDMPPVDDIICVGDVVGYNPWPQECLERVQAVSSLVVQGNHDRNVETPHRYEHNEMAHAGLELAQKELTDEQREWLAELPLRMEFAEDAYRLVHSHPDPNRLGSYVRPAQFPKMRPYLDEYDGIVLGHTHVQHEATIDGRLIVNPGSVGQPRDRDERAAYAVLDTAADEVELRRVEYDINRVLTRVEECELPIQTGTRLLDGS
ncbi:metallophosphoesterase family protein [Natrinema longum]|uniref:metallophosphoesterase family protein n=1 Tax=Natrinema longum TaxID=370324 RepID=UPI001CCBBBAC|nr:metallophosphoesterase family protein [Natrinema longum]MBZ6497165.1 metallophosphatase family protein [Natrinema longum]